MTSMRGWKAGLVVLVFVLCLCWLAVSAADESVEYPAVRIDPTTGLAYDFGGATIYIYDYWSADGGSDNHIENPDPETAALYAYRDWLMSTYNCHIVQCQSGNWNSQVDEFNHFVEAPDGSYRIYILEPGAMPTILQNGYAADWNTDLVDLSEDKWNTAMTELGTVSGATYCVNTGENEPRQLLYFNKRVLSEASIDWNTLYDMQEAGTWTWEAFTGVMRQVQQDTDGDGAADIHGLIGSRDDFIRMAVFSNGGCFFDLNALGTLTPGADSAKSVEALDWAAGVWGQYAMPIPEDASWDWYKNAWKQGNTAFYMYQAYGGFNDSSEMSDMADPWGAVAFPIGPQGDTYVTIASDNVTVMPNVYDERTTAMLSMIYDLWTNPTPGFEDANAWIGNKLNYTDSRAVMETYAMLREPSHAIADRTYLLGSCNDILGQYLLWYIGSAPADSLVEGGMPVWLNLCESFNTRYEQEGVIFTCSDGTLHIHGKGPLPDTREWSVFSGEATRIEITGTVTSICDNAFDGFSLVTEVSLPGSLTSIGANAFRDCSSLGSIALPRSVTSVGAGAFQGCTALQTVVFCGTPSEWAALDIGADNEALTGAPSFFTLLADKTPINPEETLVTVLSPGESWYSFTPPDYGMFELTVLAGGAATPTDLTGPDPMLTLELLTDSGVSEVWIAQGEAVDGGCSVSWHMNAGQSYYFKVTSDIEAEVRIQLSRNTDAYWFIDGSTLIIGGDGPMEDYSQGTAPWYNAVQDRQFNRVIIDGGVTSISSYAFCWADAVNSVEFPESLTSIGAYAFQFCSSLTELSIPASVSSIGTGAFENSGITNFHVAEDNTCFAFRNGALLTKNLTQLVFGAGQEVVIPAEVTSIPFYALTGKNTEIFTVDPDNADYASRNGLLLSKDETRLIGCPAGMSEIELPGSVTSFADNVFINSTAWRIDIPAEYTGTHEFLLNGLWGLSCISVESGNSLFMSDSGALYFADGSTLLYCPRGMWNEFTVLDGTTLIEIGAFSGCYSLTSVRLPDSLLQISETAFNNCNSLTDVWYGGSESMWNDIYIGYDNDALTYAQIHYGQVETVEWFNVSLSDAEAMIYGIVEDSRSWTSAEDVPYTYATFPIHSTLDLSEEYAIISRQMSPIFQDEGYLKNWVYDPTTGHFAEGVRSGVIMPTFTVYTFDTGWRNSTSLFLSGKGDLLNIGYENGAYDYYLTYTDATSYHAIHLTFDADTGECICFDAEEHSFNWQISGNRLTITGNWQIPPYEIGEAPWADAAGSIRYVDIGEGITGVNGGFADCHDILSVHIPSTVSEIAESFPGCTNLSFDVAEENPRYSSAGGVLFNKEGTALLNCRFSGSYEIPGGVESIMFPGFYNNTGITSLTIPVSVREISYYAFDYCENLSDVYYKGTEAQWSGISIDEGNDNLALVQLHFSAGVLAEGTFGDGLAWTLTQNGCLTVSGTGPMPDFTSGMAPWSNYADNICSVVIEDGVTSVGEAAFAYNYMQLTSVSIGSSVTSIGDNAFAYCERLASAELPAGLTRIGAGAFAGCVLTGITIPDSVTEIGDEAFLHCRGLADENGFVIIRGVLYSYCGSAAEVTVPAGVTRIGSRAFADNWELTAVIIPEGVTAIGDIAFGYCPELASVQLPSCVTEIGNGAFQGCPHLANADGLIIVGSTLQGCLSSVTAAVIPEGVTAVSDRTFDCSQSLTSVHIPSTVTSMSGAAFVMCPELTEITVSADNPSFCAIDNVLYNKDVTELIYSPISKTAVSVPATVTSIGDCAFNSSMLAEITLPSGLISIGDEAFTSCRLTSISLPEGLISIGASAFSDTRLASLTIPGSMTSIGNRAFLACGSLQSVTIGEGTAVIGGNSFANCWSLTSVTLPSTLVRIEDSAFVACDQLTDVTWSGLRSQWNAVAVGSSNDPLLNAQMHFPADPTVDSGVCGADITWSLNEDGTLTISGTGSMDDYSPDNLPPWYDYREQITGVVIEDGVTRIGVYAFAWLTSVETVHIPASVVEAGGSAFAQWHSLTARYYEGNQFGWLAISVDDDNDGFYRGTLYCDYVVTIQLPANLTVIESEAFQGLPAGTCVRITDQVESIAPDAFSYGTFLLVPAGSDWVQWAEDNGYFAVEE